MTRTTPPAGGGGGLQVESLPIVKPPYGVLTYMAADRQYIVVAVSGGVYSGEYIAFALPNGGRPTTQAQR
jgi:hypothetical protein